MKPNLWRAAMALVLLVFLSACGGYYRVTDLATEKTYYSDDVDEVSGGALRLIDANTGSIVTLQNSEVMEINKEEFRANTKKQ